MGADSLQRRMSEASHNVNGPGPNLLFTLKPPVVLRKDTLARTHSIVPLADPDPAAWTLRYVESTRTMSN